MFDRYLDAILPLISLTTWDCRQPSHGVGYLSVEDLLVTPLCIGRASSLTDSTSQSEHFLENLGSPLAACREIR